MKRTLATAFVAGTLALGGLADIDRNRFGPVAQAGLDIPLGKTVLPNFGVKKFWVDTDVNGIVSGTLKLDPWVYSAGLGFRFQSFPAVR